MQHIGIVLHLFLRPVMLVDQIIVLADNLKTGFFFTGDIHAMTCNPGTLDDETFQQDAQHLFLQAVGNGKLVFQCFGNGVEFFTFFFIQGKTDQVRRTVEQETAA